MIKYCFILLVAVGFSQNALSASKAKTTASSVKSPVATNTTANPRLVQVQGYTTKTGKYVAPYVRTAPNNTTTDNLRQRGMTLNPGYVSPNNMNF